MNVSTLFAQASETTSTNGLGAVLPLIILLVLGVAATVFTLWMFIHALTHKSENKLLWALVIFFTGFIGALAYFFVEKKKADTPSQPAAQQYAQPQAPQATSDQQGQVVSPSDPSVQPAAMPAQPESAPQQTVTPQEPTAPAVQEPAASPQDDTVAPQQPEQNPYAQPGNEGQTPQAEIGDQTTQPDQENRQQ